MSKRLSFFGAAWLCAALSACGGGGGGGGSDASAVIPVPAEVKSFFAAFDATRAMAVPTPGAAFFSMYDGCYVDSGRSKASSIAEFDADPQSAEASKFRIGSTRSGLKILADRSSTNANGSSRREIDIQYDIVFADGTVDKATTATLIQGSSAGSTLAGGATCPTPENGPEWRFYGNRRLASVSVSARNDRLDRSNLADGLPNVTPVAYSKYIVLTVEDPANVATYAIVSGPGLVFGDGTPLALKMLSPRILRDDPLLAGKRGNYVDARDTNSFAGCRTVDGYYADAPAADCVQYGAGGSIWGSTNWPTAAAADQDFGTIPGIVAGGTYTIKIYNDDGWKTVNGQAGHAPIATYTATLNHLPFSAAALAANGLFPTWGTLSKSRSEIATAIRQRTALTITGNWAAGGTMPDGSKLGWGSIYAFESGRASAGLADYPASRNTTSIFPAPGVTQGTLPVATPGAQLVLPTYAEFGLFNTNRDGNAVSSILTFQ